MLSEDAPNVPGGKKSIKLQLRKFGDMNETGSSNCQDQYRGEMTRPNINSFIHVTSAYRLPTAEEVVGVKDVGTQAVGYTRLVMTQNDEANSYVFTCVHSSNECHKINTVERSYLLLHLHILSYLYPTGWVFQL